MVHIYNEPNFVIPFSICVVSRTPTCAAVDKRHLYCPLKWRLSLLFLPGYLFRNIQFMVHCRADTVITVSFVETGYFNNTIFADGYLVLELC